MLKKIALASAFILIVGFVTLSGGEITKYFVKANRCHRTKTLLFFSGLIAATLLAIIGALYNRLVPTETQDKIANWVNNEQFRYGPEAALQKNAASEYYGNLGLY